MPLSGGRSTRVHARRRHWEKSPPNTTVSVPSVPHRSLPFQMHATLAPHSKNNEVPQRPTPLFLAGTFICNSHCCDKVATGRCFCSAHDKIKKPYHCDAHKCPAESVTNLAEISKRLAEKPKAKKVSFQTKKKKHAHTQEALDFDAKCTSHTQKPASSALLDHGLDEIQERIDAWARSPGGGEVAVFARSPKG